MMPDPSNQQRPVTCYSCLLAAGSAQARVAPPDGPTIVSPICSCNVQTARSPRWARHGFAESPPSQPLLSNLIPNLAAKSP